MKGRVENVVERGKVEDEYITCEEERETFNKWTEGFTRQDHPTVIQVKNYILINDLGRNL